MSPTRKTDERPLSARSLVASLLLRTRPPKMRGARLVEWCELFGVSEGTARVALSRMVDRGELRAENGTYELAGRVRGRRAAQDWSLEPNVRPFAGEWRMAIVEPTARDAAERGALRDAMRRLRMGEVREGLWTRPDNLPRAAAAEEAWRVAESQCQWWTGTPEGDAGELAAALFDPAGWVARADECEGRLGRLIVGLDGTRERQLADAFVAGAAALAHVRADPFLPAELAPTEQAAAALRATYGEYEQLFSKALGAWFRRRA